MYQKLESIPIPRFIIKNVGDIFGKVLDRIGKPMYISVDQALDFFVGAEILSRDLTLNPMFWLQDTLHVIRVIRRPNDEYPFIAIPEEPSTRYPAMIDNCDLKTLWEKTPYNANMRAIDTLSFKLQFGRAFQSIENLCSFYGGDDDNWTSLMFGEFETAKFFSIMGDERKQERMKQSESDNAMILQSYDATILQKLQVRDISKFITPKYRQNWVKAGKRRQMALEEAIRKVIKEHVPIHTKSIILPSQDNEQSISPNILATVKAASRWVMKRLGKPTRINVNQAVNFFISAEILDHPLMIYQNAYYNNECQIVRFRGNYHPLIYFPIVNDAMHVHTAEHTEYGNECAINNRTRELLDDIEGCRFMFQSLEEIPHVISLVEEKDKIILAEKLQKVRFIPIAHEELKIQRTERIQQLNQNHRKHDGELETAIQEWIDFVVREQKQVLAFIRNSSQKAILETVKQLDMNLCELITSYIISVK